MLTFNKTLPNIKNVIDKHWHTLSISKNLRKVFYKRPFIDYRRNTNLHQLIGGNRIFKHKVVRENTKTTKTIRTLFTMPFKNEQSLVQTREANKNIRKLQDRKTFQIFHNLKCKSENLIYLLQCRICQLQYIGKIETPFNIRLRNHRKDAK